jgi:hypothetical protein
MKPKERKTILILSFFTIVFGAYIVFDYFKPVINVDNTQNKSISVTEKDDFFEYLGMTYGDLEKKLGQGKMAKILYEEGGLIYRFGGGETLFIFSTDGDLWDEECQTVIIPLKEVLETNAETLTRNQLANHFEVEFWSIQPEHGFLHGMERKVYFVYGLYKNRHFNMYLDSDKLSNRHSVSLDEKVYFYKGL